MSFYAYYVCILQSCTPNNSLTVHDISMQFMERVLGKDDVSHAKMVVANVLLSMLLIIFPSILVHLINQ